ncbi:MAG: hypothetical protein R3223_00880 [Longimicrobiales bacterium]|nr:hypothetical protein [Longimicrobiales bacterium]
MTGLTSGVFVALVGGMTTYFALANSGFIPWSLALASLLLVLATKVPLAVVAAWMLDRRGGNEPEALPID